MVFAALLASGSGSRFGSDLPKQFLELDGTPILIKSLSVFLDSGLLDAVVVTAPAAYLAYTKRLISDFLPENPVPVTVIEGGKNRSRSLQKALTALADAYGRTGHIVLTHDAVRPFLTRRIIEDNVKAAREYGAANTCVPATDTVFLSEDGFFMGTVPARSAVFHSQTPQTFRLDTILDLIDGLPADEFDAMTDGCSVFIRSGLPVRMVPGSPDNLKITYPGDLRPRPAKEDAEHA